MRQTILTAALALSLVSTVAVAHQVHSTAEGNQTGQMGSGMMMGGQGHGMMGMHGQGKGMMGMHGKGMGMMGKSGQCIKGGQGMHGAGMMGSGMMGSDMHGAGMMGSGSVEQRDAFLNSTKELRKSIHDKSFEYMEATRNPEETVGGLQKKAEELSTLKQELMDKRQKAFTQDKSTQ